jgi:hypothetical protein
MSPADKNLTDHSFVDESTQAALDDLADALQQRLGDLIVRPMRDIESRLGSIEGTLGRVEEIRTRLVSIENSLEAQGSCMNTLISNLDESLKLARSADQLLHESMMRRLMVALVLSAISLTAVIGLAGAILFGLR